MADHLARERWMNRYIVAAESILTDEQVATVLAYANEEGDVPDPIESVAADGSDLVRASDERDA